MAEAKKITIVQPTEGIGLELTMEEANALRSVLGNTGALDIRDCGLEGIWVALKDITNVVTTPWRVRR